MKLIRSTVVIIGVILALPGVVSRLFVLLLALCLPSTYVLAAGFRIPDVSIAGMGVSNAVVADAKDVGALPYNPAAMSFHKDTNLDSGLVYLQFDLSVTHQRVRT